MINTKEKFENIKRIAIRSK